MFTPNNPRAYAKYFSSTFPCAFPSIYVFHYASNYEQKKIYLIKSLIIFLIHVKQAIIVRSKQVPANNIEF